MTITGGLAVEDLIQRPGSTQPLFRRQGTGIVHFDPVHQTAETGQPAEKIHGDALPRFDKVSISAEGAAFQALSTPCW